MIVKYKNVNTLTHTLTVNVIMGVILKLIPNDNLGDKLETINQLKELA